MGTEVRSMFGGESKSEEPTAMITRDLLGNGGSSSIETQELDLHSQSGKVYFQRYNTLDSPLVSEHKSQMNQAGPKLQDLNFSPFSSKLSMNPFNESSLDLKLVSPSLPSSTYQSVCTLDNVKSALERVEKEPTTRKRATPLRSQYLSSPCASYSSSSSSIRETQEEEFEGKLSSPMAAGCPGCLSYVLIMKHNPKCPRCNSLVPFPLMKKPKIDLNISI
ncbi:uncharacterized protein LOC109793898 isoform X2 [Cajanus cajan]|uniref:uncharacterized protein LOC109793898 isoform X2 n=1 Tax=Cajanus cajan TaxID=3821 RepID=UPI00098DAB3A|nr:uncharacterized protein LOC109793898 isoform X2 [Cajanus cajan]